MPRFYTVNHNRIQQNTVTIIDETPTITSTQRKKQAFSPKQTFPPEPYVKVPLPKLLNAEEFLPRKPGGNKTSNAFIIYRTVFSKELIEKDYQSKMTDVSKWASKSWKNEKADIKAAYKDFAREIQLTHKQRSREALVSRNRRLMAANVPRLNNSPSPTPTQVTVPSQMNSPRNENPAYQQTNLIDERNVNIPRSFPSYQPSIPPNFNPDKELQENDLLNSTNAYDYFGQSPSIEDDFPFESLNRDFEVSFLMQHILSQEIYSEVHPFYNDDEDFGL